MTKEFNNIDEIQKYYDEKINAYVFKDYELVVFNFNFDVQANIYANRINALVIIAWHINAKDIIAKNINAWNINTDIINARDIKAQNINAWNIKSWDIDAFDIIAKNINAWNILAHDIYAHNIKANDINYNTVCFAYENIKCKSIKGRKENAKHFVLDGTLEVEENVD